MKFIHDELVKKGISEDYFTPYGRDISKIDYKLIDKLEDRDSNLILVSAITPTKSGEGKTTMSISLSDGLKYLNKNVMLTLREPSLGPVFGLKGGACGGGESIVLPSEKINLHFTGDFHAITSAHNLLSALIDNHIYQGNSLKFKKVIWPRAMDMNDRSLRKITYQTREDSFIITAASEIMAIMALSENLEDLGDRINNILIGYNEDNNPIKVCDLKCRNALVILLRDALSPNLVQTKYGCNALIHLGPFANIAHGCNSLIATKLALKLSDYVVTEAGFGADLGLQKFLSIKVPLLKKHPNLVVLVATIKALKEHGSSIDNLERLKEGLSNLYKHYENISKYNIPILVAINKFNDDSPEEILLLESELSKKHIEYSLVTSYVDGPKGATQLASKAIQIIEANKLVFKDILENKNTLFQKLETICYEIYGANKITLTKNARENLKQIEDNNWDKLPVCVAKTPLSFTTDSEIKGAPNNFNIEFSSFSVSLGAKFIVAKTKGIVLMPGLNEHPLALDMSL
ncbi:MAG: formate--tetrahydrofolate ligase [Acholeplasmatales bacterium]|jgi:formate--tetrahydrofolate ligase|nr:formate--tetrahydrofolate ligase [Acholeplasmatales bacterium]